MRDYSQEDPRRGTPDLPSPREPKKADLRSVLLLIPLSKQQLAWLQQSQQQVQAAKSSSDILLALHVQGSVAQVVKINFFVSRFQPQVPGVSRHTIEASKAHGGAAGAQGGRGEQVRPELHRAGGQHRVHGERRGPGDGDHGHHQAARRRARQLPGRGRQRFRAAGARALCWGTVGGKVDVASCATCQRVGVATIALQVILRVRCRRFRVC